MKQRGFMAKLARRSEAQVCALHGMGPSAVARLRASLEAEGLRFRNDRDP
jgi:hypothetical protein